MMERTIDTPGIYDLPEDVYHADPCPEPSLSSTLARKLLAQSPLHAWTASPRLNPDFQPVEKEVFDIGRVCHAILLGNGRPVHVVDADSWATKAAREQRDKARAAGDTPLLVEQFKRVVVMRDAVAARLEQFGVDIDAGRNEISAIARIGDVWCRALIDHAPDAGPLYDLKTCEDASPDACIRAVTGYGYDVQAAHYLDTWKAASGEDRGFRFIFVEKAPPHEVSVIELHQGDDDADWWLSARDKVREARRIWGECLRYARWPGYPAQVAVVGAPAFHIQKWEGRPKPSVETLATAAKWQAPHGDAA